MKALNRNLRDVKQKMRQAAREVRDAGRKAAREGQSSTVNSDVRTNIQVRVNTGSEDSEEGAIASQYAPIYQGPKPD